MKIPQKVRNKKCLVILLDLFLTDIIGLQVEHLFDCCNRWFFEWGSYFGKPVTTPLSFLGKELHDEVPI